MPKNNKNALNDLDGKDWIKYTVSWFIINPRPRTKQEIMHPAKFPEELVERFVRFFTKKHQWVLDPFLGVGSTLVACRNLRRNGTGIEINPTFYRIAKKRLSQRTLSDDVRQDVILGNSLELDKVLSAYYQNDIPDFNFSISSPPYYNMLKKSRGGSNSTHKERKEKGLNLTYGGHEGNLENIDSYEEYMDCLVRVYSKVHEFLKNKSYIVIVVQNMRDVDGKMRLIAWDLAKKLDEIYTLRQEQIWCQANKKLGIWGYPTTYVSNVHHHYCLILQKVE